MLSKKEGFKAYSLFLDYVSLGTARTLAAVAQKSGRTPQLISNLAGTYKWASRAKAYDQYLVDVQMKTIEKSVKQDAVLWAQRHASYRNEEYLTAQSLLDVAKQMLATPLFETVQNELKLINGELVPVKITIKPAKWTMNTAPLFVDTAAKLFRLSLEMDTSRERLTIDLKNDPEERLARAKASVEKLTDKLDEIVDAMLAADPTLDREQAREQLKGNIPTWVSSDWDVPLELLQDDAVPQEVPGGDHVN